MSRSLSTSSRTLLLCGVIALGAIAVNGATVAYAEMERADVINEFMHLDVLTQQASAMGRAIATQGLALDDYLLTGDPVDRSRYVDAVAIEHRTAAAMQDAAAELPGVATALDALGSATTAWRANVAEPALAATLRPPGTSAGGTGAAANQIAPVAHAAALLTNQLQGARLRLVERDELLTTQRAFSTAFQVLTGIGATFGALYFIRRFARALARDAERSSVINRFTESTAFARDDTALASSSLEALGLLVEPDAGVTHALNRSLDRAVPEATRGDPVAEVLPLKALSHCPGIFQGSTYVTSDAGQPLSVQCPVYPIASGTLACVPLISGETVGAIHLYWQRPNSLPLDMLADVNRIAQHAALAIGNRRLLAALQGQASTDARTGLPNSRAFDLVLESELANLNAGAALGVLMVDVDHFKDFNDRHGHPAGDEALRAFSGVLRSCVRDDDIAARYGGEEFSVMLRGLDLEAAMVVAERIRSRTESTLIALGPGITDRITVSIGVACAPEHGLDRVSLLRAADEALYQAKEAGRNRVVYRGGDPKPNPAPMLTAALA